MSFVGDRKVHVRVSGEVAVKRLGLLLATTVVGAAAARAEQAVSCGGFAMMGGAQINCSHLAPKQPTQFCTFSWALLNAGNAPTVVSGSFIVPPGANNEAVYQGAGFTGALSNPIVLCQGKKSR